MKVLQMPPVHAANLVANSGNTAYGVGVIARTTRQMKMLSKSSRLLASTSLIFMFIYVLCQASFRPWRYSGYVHFNIRVLMVQGTKTLLQHWHFQSRILMVTFCLKAVLMACDSSRKCRPTTSFCPPPPPPPHQNLFSRGWGNMWHWIQSA